MTHQRHPNPQVKPTIQYSSPTGLILTPDAYAYLRVPASISAARQARRTVIPAHLIDPRAQAAIEIASQSYLAAVPPRRRLMLEGTAQLAYLVYAVDPIHDQHTLAR